MCFPKSSTRTRYRLAGFFPLFFFCVAASQAHSDEKKVKPFIPPGDAACFGDYEFKLEGQEFIVSLGELETKQALAGFVNISNLMTQTVLIGGVKSSCGCLAGYPTKPTVESKEKFRVYFNLAGQNSGKVEKRIVFHGASTEQALFSVVLTGLARPPFLISKSRFLSSEKEVSARLVVVDGKSSAEDISIEVLGGAFASVDVKHIASSESRPEFMLNFTLATPAMDRGSFEKQGLLRVVLSNARTHEVPLTLVNPDAFVVKPLSAVLQQGEEPEELIYRCFVRSTKDVMLKVEEEKVFPELVLDGKEMISRGKLQPIERIVGETAMCYYSFFVPNFKGLTGHQIVWRNSTEEILTTIPVLLHHQGE